MTVRRKVMMGFKHTVAGKVYAFASVRDLLAKSSPARSGDYLAGIAAGNDEERVAAQMALADVPLKTFLIEHVVPYDSDEVTRLIIDGHDAKAFAPVSHLTVGGWRRDAQSVSTRSIAFGMSELAD
jgi:ethanolamine ammonia-lyase large subunit